MRATKAYIASLGTTGVLLASALSLLAIVGAIVAFNGWPSGGVADDIRRLVVGDEEPSSLSAGAVSEAVDSASVTADAVVTDEPLGPDVDDVVADFVPPSSLGPSTPGTTPGGDSPVTGAPDVGGPGNGSPTTGAPDGGDGTGGPVDQIVGSLPSIPGVNPSNGTLLSTEPLTDGLSDTVNGTTDTLGGAVGGPLGQTVDQAGDNLTDLVRGLPDIKIGSQPK